MLALLTGERVAPDSVPVSGLRQYRAHTDRLANGGRYKHLLGYVFEAVWGRAFGGADAIKLRGKNAAESTASDWRVQNHNCAMYSIQNGGRQEPCRLPAGCIADQDLTDYKEYAGYKRH
jgi:hypothetical protein